MPTSDMIGIKGSGAYFPRQVVEVKELARQHHLDYHVLLEDHGIKHIHLASNDETETFMAIQAVKEALADSKLKPDSIDMIIFCKGITRQKTARPIASQIIEHIKASNAYGFDIEGGLIGGLIGIQVANDIIKNNYNIRNAVIVASQEFDEMYLFGGEASRVRNMVFGDGAAAVVLSKDAANNKILSSEFVIDHYTSFIDEMLIESMSKESGLNKIFGKMRMGAVVKRVKQGKSLSRLTERWVENSYRVIEACMREINLDVSDINHFIKTQLSLRETELLCKKLNIQKTRIYNTSPEKGHLGPADIIYNLHSTLKNTMLKNLDIIALVSANYDCSSGAIVLRR